MKKVTEKADRCVKKCNWKDLALLKLCLCSAGLMAGLCIPKEKKKGPLLAAGGIFLTTYIVLASKFLNRVQRADQDNK